MRIVFFGSPKVALPSFEKLLEAGHSIELAVTQPDRPAGRGKRLSSPPVKEAARKRGIPVLQPEKIRTDELVLATLRKIGPDINIVVAYGQILPAAIIDLPRYKSVNVHFSLLPKYRGAAPVQWAILNGENKTGVTIFELNEKLDEGDTLGQLETEIGPRENAGELEERLSRLGADLLVITLERIDSIPRLPQDQAMATSAPRLRKDQGEIAWKRDAFFIDRMVRAFSPRPGAFTFWQGHRLTIHAGRPRRVPPPHGGPGQIVEIRKEGPVVACGEGTAYQIERLQRENRKAMAASDFLRGTKVRLGDALG